MKGMYGRPAVRNGPDAGQLKSSLVDRLKRLGIARAIRAPAPRELGLRRQDSAVFLNTGSKLMAGLRRNQSLPAMIGALGAPVCTQASQMDILQED